MWVGLRYVMITKRVGMRVLVVVEHVVAEGQQLSV